MTIVDVNVEDDDISSVVSEFIESDVIKLVEEVINDILNAL